MEKEEVSRLRNSTIQGPIIRVEEPIRQGILTLSNDEERAREIGSSIGVINLWNSRISGGKIHTFLMENEYSKLLDRGYTGTRYNSSGSKISLKTITDRIPLSAANLQFYYDNYRDRVPRQQFLF